jgi:hypothetical protein
MELAIGNYLRLSNREGTQSWRFQNFFISQTASFETMGYAFLPFGFSGVSVNRNGDNTEASLVFPNNELSRAWAHTAVKESWIGHVNVMLLNPDDNTEGQVMHQYTGQVSAGGWDETNLTLNLNTILDAVGSDVPLRRLTQSLVGKIPVSANVRLR